MREMWKTRTLTLHLVNFIPILPRYLLSLNYEQGISFVSNSGTKSKWHLGMTRGKGECGERPGRSIGAFQLLSTPHPQEHPQPQWKHFPVILRHVSPIVSIVLVMSALTQKPCCGDQKHSNWRENCIALVLPQSQQLWILNSWNESRIWKCILIWYWTLITTERIETYRIATYSIRTLLKMDYWSAKHVELLNVINKII